MLACGLSQYMVGSDSNMVESDLRGQLGQIGTKTEAKTNSDKSGIRGC